MADNFTRQIFNTLRANAGGSYNFSPASTGAGTGGATITTGAGAWGAYADLIAAKGVTTEFWVCGLAVNTASAAQVFQLQLYNATLAALIADFQADLTAATANLSTMMLPFPIYEAANTQVQCRGGGAAAKTILAQVLYLSGI